MKKLLIPVLITTCFLSMATNCKNRKPSTTNCEGVMCTAMFAMINITVKDNAGNSVKLDEFHTTRLGTKEVIHPENAGMDGSYTVLDDSYMKQLMNTIDSFRFTGTKNGKEIVNEVFAIGGDCCHINKVSGKELVIITP